MARWHAVATQRQKDSLEMQGPSWLQKPFSRIKICCLLEAILAIFLKCKWNLIFFLITGKIPMKMKFHWLLWLSDSVTGHSRLIGAAESCPASDLEPLSSSCEFLGAPSKQLLAHYFLSPLLTPWIGNFTNGNWFPCQPQKYLKNPPQLQAQRALFTQWAYNVYVSGLRKA